MVLSVPPLLAELGRGTVVKVSDELTVWQGEMWNAAQWLRTAVAPAPTTPRWMGTLEQLESVIGGSVVLGGKDNAPVVVPLSTGTTPAVKESPSGPLVRLESHPGQSGRYVSLQVIIGTSEGIWPAVISVDGRGGREAGGLRTLEGQRVELQVVPRANSRVGFRLVDAATRAVISMADSAEDLARELSEGAEPMPWAAFLERCLWGRPAISPPPTDASKMVDNGAHMRAVASLWGMEPLGREQVLSLRWKLTEAFSERLTAVEARQSKGSSARAEQHTKAPYSANKYDKKKGEDFKAGAKPGGKGVEPAKNAAGKQTRAAGVNMDDGAATHTAKAAAKALEESMQGSLSATKESCTSRVKRRQW
ncbi:hypothetical protein AB1Y20_023692 [Prymnesium parvum]|uniref:Uncharacterized protein n=1 Tax=Prymnesium parvum TaxID=97485 RepID=A0AB34JHE9_PRYPA